MNKRKQAKPKMAGKKGQMVQLQIEVTTNEEWKELLTKKGLVVVDLYSEWCGPCVGMTGTLKKVKLDIGGESLTFATAKTDTVDALERFRNRSEPTWMFIGSGHLVNVMFGANAPKLTTMIYAELGKEESVLKGETERVVVPWDELTEEERIRYEEEEKKRQEALEKEKQKEAAAAALIHQKEVRNLMKYISMYTVVLIMPYLYDEEGSCDAWVKLMDALSSKGYQVYDDNKFLFDPELAKELLYDGTKEISEEFADILSKGPTVAKFMQYKPPQSEDAPDEDLQEPPAAADEAAEQEEDEEEEEMGVSLEDAIIECVKTIYGTPPAEGGGVQKVAPKSLQAQFQKQASMPAFWTPNTPFMKGHAILKFFSKWASQYALPPEPKLPPVIVIVYNASKSSEVFDMMNEMPDAVVRHAFFSGPDHETAKLLTTSKEQYDKRAAKEPQDTLVIAVDRTGMDAVLTFCFLLPLYASANPDEGLEDFHAFFKEKGEEEDEEEEEEEDEEEEVEEGVEMEGEGEEMEGEEEAEEGEEVGESEGTAAEADEATHEEGEAEDEPAAPEDAGSEAEATAEDEVSNSAPAEADS